MSETSIVVSDYFKCPSCKCDVIEEVQVDVTLSSKLTDIHYEDECTEIEYDEDVSWDGGFVDRYQCANCGLIIKDEEGKSVEYEDLAEWLIEHKEKREKEQKTS